MRLAWVFMLSILAPAVAGAQAAEPDTGAASGAEAELIALERQWEQALLAGDAKALAPLLADDLVYTAPNGERNAKAEELDNLASGRYKVTAFTAEPMQVKVFGDAAVVFGGHTEKSTFNGEDTSGRYRWTETWIKRNGRWQAVAGQINRLPEGSQP